MLHVVAGLCLFLSGAFSLVQEIAWIRKASLVFGAASFALSTVLAVFFGGLAIGSVLGGRLSERVARPLRSYGWIEIAIGLLAFASPLTFRAAEAAYGAVYPALYESFALLSLVRVLGVSTVLLPPAILMGATLPLFCAEIVRSERRIGRSVGLLYAVNTVGAAVGCALCGFVLIPRLGVDASIRAAAIGNVIVGVAAFGLSRWSAPRAAAPATAPDALPPATSGRLLPALFFATGFVALANEVLWTRFLSLLLHNTVYTYTITLTVMLAGIVLGSLAGAPVLDALRRRALVFGGVQVATGLVVTATLLLPRELWEHRADPDSLGAQALLATSVLLLPAFLSGLSFPLAVRMAVHDPARAGAGVGRMAALNTAGGIAGSLATGFLLLPALGLSRTLALVTGTSLAIGFAAWLFLARETPRAVTLLLAAGAAALWLVLPVVSGTRLPQDYLARGRELLDFREGVSANLSVVREDGVETLEIDRLWQGEKRKTHQVMAAHVPMLFAPHPERVLLVGLGPGQTASRFLHYPIERLDCVDIESRLVPLVRDHFDSGWMEDERVRFITEDGRNFLAHTQERWDVISIEIGQVFRPGLAGFYTEEFYRRARERLRADGIVSQFVPLGYFTPEQLRTVVASFLAVFPEAVLWYNKSEFLLLGSTSDRPLLRSDRLSLLERFAPVRDDLAFSYWGGPDEWLQRREVFLGGFVLGPAGLARLAAGAPLYHDDRPWLEYETSHRGASAESELVKDLAALAEPIDSILDAPLEPASRARAEEIRTANLRDLLAARLVRYVQQPEGRAPGFDRLGALRRAVEWNGRNVWAQIHLAEELRRAGQPFAASDAARRAIRIDPSLGRAHFELASALTATGETTAAISAYEEALRLTPGFAPAHLGLAALLQARGDAAGAIAHYRAASDAAPVASRLRIGLLLAAQGDVSGAREALEEAVRRGPDDPDATRALALLLNDAAWRASTDVGASDAARAAAVGDAERAVALTARGDAALLDTLAAAYAAAGRYADAVSTARDAEALARASGDEALQRALAVRRAAYESGRPWREDAPPAGGAQGAPAPGGAAGEASRGGA